MFLREFLHFRQVTECSVNSKLNRRIRDAFSNFSSVATLIIKITISSIVIGLKTPVFAKLLMDSLLLDRIKQSFIGQFNNPITFKVVV